MNKLIIYKLKFNYICYIFSKIIKYILINNSNNKIIFLFF